MAEANVLVLTYNCGREAVNPSIFAHYIQQTIEDETAPDHELLVLSLQEISPMPYAFIGGGCLSFYYQKLDQAVKEAFDGQYVSVLTKNIGTTAIMVYVRRACRGNIGSIESGAVGVGWMETGNKGAVGVKLSWLLSPGEYVDLTFLAAHLAPHEPAVERRNQDWMHIVQRVVFQSIWVSDARLQVLQDQDSPSELASESESQPLLAKDHAAPMNRDKSVGLSTIYNPMSWVFLAGDLNYRVSDNHPSSEDHARFPKVAKDSDLIEALATSDQLRIESKAGRTLHGFKETCFRFEPTYKYSSEAQRIARKLEEQGKFVSSEHQELPLNYASHRWPSWCDRIMYLLPLVEPSGAEGELTTNFYRSLPLMSTSDHQPVAASFTLSLRQPLSPMHSGRAEMDDHWIRAPYAVDSAWHERYLVARRREFAIGLAAYLGLTWTGNSMLLGTAIGIFGAYILAKGAV